MTKSEKEKAKKAQARLESMRAAGMVVGDTSKAQATAAPAKSSASMFSKKKNTNSKTAPVVPSAPQEEESQIETAEEDNIKADDNAQPAAAMTNDDVADAWDDIDEDEVAAKVMTIKVSASARFKLKTSDFIVFVCCVQIREGIGIDEEDRLEAEKRVEQERLRVLGIERSRRDEELRIKRCANSFISTLVVLLRYALYLLCVQRGGRTRKRRDGN